MGGTDQVLEGNGGREEGPQQTLRSEPGTMGWGGLTAAFTCGTKGAPKAWLNEDKQAALFLLEAGNPPVHTTELKT